MKQRSVAVITYDMSARAGKPLYEHLHRSIRDDIRLGVLAPGYRLPSKKSLAKHLDVSVSTVERAYEMLVGEGYARSKPGSGFFVEEGRSGLVKDPGQDEGLRADAAAERHLDVNANRSSLSLFPVDTWIKLMRRTLSERNKALFETVPFNGLAELRRAIALHLLEFKGMQVHPDQIIVGAGTEYLYGRLMRLFGRHRTFAIGDVSSLNLVETSRELGAVWDYVPVDDEGLDVEHLRRGPAEIVHVAPANHFPIGTVMSEARRRDLMEWLHEDPRRYVIEDDYDSELRYAGRALPPLFTQDEDERVIYLNTFSKTLVPSIRISYMVLPRALVSLYDRQCGFWSCSVSSFEQSCLALFIEDGSFERHVNRLRRHYRKQRDLLVESLEASPLSRISRIKPVDVGTHLVMEVDSTLSDSAIEKSAHKQGLKLRMLSDYCQNVTVDRSHSVVLNFASFDAELVPEVVRLLENVFSDDIRRAGQLL